MRLEQKAFESIWEKVATEETWVSPYSQHYINPLTRVDVFNAEDFTGTAYRMGEVRTISYRYRKGLAVHWSVICTVLPDRSIDMTYHGITEEAFIQFWSANK